MTSPAKPGATRGGTRRTCTRMIPHSAARSRAAVCPLADQISGTVPEAIGAGKVIRGAIEAADV